MNFKIEYLIDKNRIVTILQERVENCEQTIYALEKIGEDGVIIIYMVYANELRRVARIIDGQDIQDTEQLNKAFLSELPMTVDISEQTRDLVVWL